MCIYVCACMGFLQHECRGLLRSYRASDFLEKEQQIVFSYHVGAGRKPWSSAKAVCSPNP